MNEPAEPLNDSEQCAMEMEEVLKKHDCCGTMTVVSKDHLSFRHHVGASWSCIYFEEFPEGTAIRLRARTEDFKTEEEKINSLKLSVGMIMTIRSQAERSQHDMDDFLRIIGKHFKSLELTEEMIFRKARG